MKDGEHALAGVRVIPVPGDGRPLTESGVQGNEPATAPGAVDPADDLAGPPFFDLHDLAFPLPAHPPPSPDRHPVAVQGAGPGARRDEDVLAFADKGRAVRRVLPGGLSRCGDHEGVPVRMGLKPSCDEVEGFGGRVPAAARPDKKALPRQPLDRAAEGGPVRLGDREVTDDLPEGGRLCKMVRQVGANVFGGRFHRLFLCLTTQ